MWNLKFLLAACFSALALCDYRRGSNRGSPTERQRSQPQSSLLDRQLTIFAEAVDCADPIFGFDGPRDYTARNDRQCCFEAATRPLCCMDRGTGTCRCSSRVSCGFVPPQPPPQPFPPQPFPPQQFPPQPFPPQQFPPQQFPPQQFPPQQFPPQPFPSQPFPSYPQQYIPFCIPLPYPYVNPFAPSTSQPTAQGSQPAAQGSQPATQTAPRSLCAVTNRVLGGNSVPNSCDFPGVSNITTQGGAGVTCNAVYVNADVNGVTKRTFLTTQRCKGLVQNVGATLNMEVMIGNSRLSTSSFRLVDSSNGNAFLDPVQTIPSSNLGPCQQPACHYNPTTMSGLVDMTDCRLVSYGASSAASLQSNGLNAVAVSLDANGCQASQTGPQSAGVLTMCFRSTSGDNILCSGDGGAPVYCRAPQNSEWILMGITLHDVQTCGVTDEARVIPFPL